MDLKTRTLALLTAMLTITYVSAMGYENITFGHVDETSNNADNLMFLSNCLADNGLEGDIKWFEPLACSEGGDSIQMSTSIQTESYGFDDAGISTVSHIVDETDSFNVGDLYADFEDPYEVGWD